MSKLVGAICLFLACALIAPVVFDGAMLTGIGVVVFSIFTLLGLAGVLS